VVQQLKAELAEGGDLDRMEDKVYCDLYTFFSRYYSDDDFLSLSRYKEGVYAMPYEGGRMQTSTTSGLPRTSPATPSRAPRVGCAWSSRTSALSETTTSPSKAANGFILADAPLALEGCPRSPGRNREEQDPYVAVEPRDFQALKASYAIDPVGA